MRSLKKRDIFLSNNFAIALGDFVQKNKRKHSELKSVEIVKDIPGGFGLAFYEKKPVFVEKAISGEVVDIEVYRSNSKGIFGRVKNYEKTSEKRVEAPCEYYDRCGGCDLMHVDYETQLEIKNSYLKDQLRRIGGLDEEELEELQVVGHHPWNYRSRVRFHKEGKSWGFLKGKSHEVIDLKKCLVLVDELQPELLKSLDCEDGSYSFQSDDQGKVAAAREEISIEVCGKKFPVKAGAFFQSNLKVLPDLVEFVIKNMPEEIENGIDLFAGIGFFSAFMAPRAEKVWAIERDVKCKDAALKYLPQNVEYITRPAEDWVVGQMGERFDFLIVDPPRTGLPDEVKRFMIGLKPEKFIYVSCNPATLARDLKEFKAGGYKIENLRGFDFYPQTSHLEAVAVLSL